MFMQRSLCVCNNLYVYATISILCPNRKLIFNKKYLPYLTR